MNDSEHPTRLSREAIASTKREDCLSLCAETPTIQAPFGLSPIGATGCGHRGALAARA